MALDGHTVVSAELVPYAHEATYDILPASDTGMYFAAGVAIASTLTDAPPAMTYRVVHQDGFCRPDASL